MDHLGAQEKRNNKERKMEGVILIIMLIFMFGWIVFINIAWNSKSRWWCDKFNIHNQDVDGVMGGDYRTHGMDGGNGWKNCRRCGRLLFYAKSGYFYNPYRKSHNRSNE